MGNSSSHIAHDGKQTLQHSSRKIGPGDIIAYFSLGFCLCLYIGKSHPNAERCFACVASYMVTLGIHCHSLSFGPHQPPFTITISTDT